MLTNFVISLLFKIDGSAGLKKKTVNFVETSQKTSSNSNSVFLSIFTSTQRSLSRASVGRVGWWVQRSSSTTDARTTGTIQKSFLVGPGQGLRAHLVRQGLVVGLALIQSLPAGLVDLAVDVLSLQQRSHQRSLALVMLALIALLVESMEKDSRTQQADQLCRLTIWTKKVVFLQVNDTVHGGTWRHCLN